MRPLFFYAIWLDKKRMAKYDRLFSRSAPLCGQNGLLEIVDINAGNTVSALVQKILARFSPSYVHMKKLEFALLTLLEKGQSITCLKSLLCLEQRFHTEWCKAGQVQMYKRMKKEADLSGVVLDCTTGKADSDDEDNAFVGAPLFHAAPTSYAGALDKVDGYPLPAFMLYESSTTWNNALRHLAKGGALWQYPPKGNTYLFSHVWKQKSSEKAQLACVVADRISTPHLTLDIKTMTSHGEYAYSTTNSDGNVYIVPRTSLFTFALYMAREATDTQRALWKFIQQQLMVGNATVSERFLTIHNRAEGGFVIVIHAGSTTNPFGYGYNRTV